MSNPSTACVATECEIFSLLAGALLAARGVIAVVVVSVVGERRRVPASLALGPHVDIMARRMTPTWFARNEAVIRYALL